MLFKAKRGKKYSNLKKKKLLVVVMFSDWEILHFLGLKIKRNFKFTNDLAFWTYLEDHIVNGENIVVSRKLKQN